MRKYLRYSAVAASGCCLLLLLLRMEILPQDGRHRICEGCGGVREEDEREMFGKSLCDASEERKHKKGEYEAGFCLNEIYEHCQPQHENPQQNIDYISLPSLACGWEYLHFTHTHTHTHVKGRFV